MVDYGTITILWGRQSIGGSWRKLAEAEGTDRTHHWQRKRVGAKEYVVDMLTW